MDTFEPLKRTSPFKVPPAKGNLFVTAVLEALIAFASIPSSFVPSAETSLPSTVPVTVIFPVTSIPAAKSQFP